MHFYSRLMSNKSYLIMDKILVKKYYSHIAINYVVLIIIVISISESEYHIY